MRTIIAVSLWLLLIGGVAFVHRARLTGGSRAASTEPCPITVKESYVSDGVWCIEVTCKGEESIWMRTSGPPVLVWKSKPE